ncbi:MAG: glutamine-hydrolyzing carbamoyl-phosphate synthase small subunit [Lentisphaeria bacterium]
MSKNWNWKAKREKEAFLALEDGSIFRGYSVGAEKDSLGEVVFNTGMSGYEEIVSDPSYNGQIVTMTYPEIGNYGFNPEDMESRGLFANGFIAHEIKEPHNWRSTQSLPDALKANSIPAICGIDTRALTLTLRSAGTLKGFISVSGAVSEADAVAKAKAWDGLDGKDYASKVSCKESYLWDPEETKSISWGLDCTTLPPADIKVVAYDFGIKWNILRRLRQHGMAVTVVPAQTSAAEVLALKPDGVFLSNGPADPAAVTYAVDAIRMLVGKVPLMGICLGHQLLGIALGGRTERLKFGHHGCNHPVKNLRTNAVEITSQNHNFTIDMDSLDASKVDVTHINLNDGTVEGIRCRYAPAFSVQYHPEAAPGPHDAAYLFDDFRKMIQEA